jgi:hypothetical protein
LRTSALCGLGRELFQVVSWGVLWRLKFLSPGLTKLEARLAQSDKPPVSNLGAYFKTLTSGDVPAIKAVEEPKAVKAIGNVDAVEAPADERKSVLSLAREEFMSLSNSEKQLFAEAAVGILESNGLITGRLRKNAKEGFWTGI